MVYNIANSGRRDHDRMVLGLTATSAYHHKSFNSVHREVHTIQHYVIQFLSDLRQVSGFLRVLSFPPAIKPSP
jgi:hypothetical protein